MKNDNYFMVINYGKFINVWKLSKNYFFYNLDLNILMVKKIISYNKIIINIFINGVWIYILSC